MPAAKRLQGTQGFSSLGVVVGATHPDHAPRVREMLPTALFLVPGYGAQGGSAAAAVAGFVRSAAGRLEGGVVNSSRALLFPDAAQAATSAAAWEAAVDEAVDRAASGLAAAVG
jgi:orotidine-5'-phosphate decarboxylase